jgi:5-methylcytosine-specific restriction enzyme subunit McrC
MENNLPMEKKMHAILKRGEVLHLGNIGISENDANIKLIENSVLDKNREYVNVYSFPLNHKILDFNKKDFTIKSNDYFGFIELCNKIVKSDGDYFLEYDQKESFIEEDDIQYLINNFNNRIYVVGYQKTSKHIAKLQNGAYLIKANSYVGVISLPSGFRIQIIPKITDVALYYIICYLHKIEIPTYEISKFPEGRFFLDIIALIFKYELEMIIQQGLFKKYVDEEENRRFLKGKLLINMQTKYNFVNKHLFYCAYDELTYDNLENQTLLYVLTLLISLVSDVKLKQDLVDLKWILKSEITPIRHLQVEDVEKITFSKLNEYYMKIITLSKQIIGEVYIGDIHAVEIEDYGYLLDMNYLFQELVFELVKDALSPKYEVKGQKQGINSLIEPEEGTPKVIIKPDILIYSDKIIKLAIDTKYKKIDLYKEKWKSKSQDLYQIISYSLAYKSNSILIYPQMGDQVKYKYSFSSDLNNVEWDVFIRTLYINYDGELSKHGFNKFISEIKKELTILIHYCI